MVHKIKKSKSNFIEWGFDLTQVNSDNDFVNLLKEFGFKEVSSMKPEDKIMLSGGKPIDMTFKNMYGERFTSYHNTFQSPEGIKIKVEHMGGKKNGDEGFLGYIGIKAPKSAMQKLTSFLSRFRGKEAITATDWSGRKGIARYVKEESPNESGFIGVE